MEATVLLSDFAEAVNGKLYVMGGGWNILYAPNRPVNVSVALVLAIGWDETNRRHDLRIELLDADGNSVEIDGTPVVVMQQFELGRPPGVKPGSSMNTPLSWTFSGLVLDEGGYEFKVSVDGDPLASRPFSVQPPPGMPGVSFR
jgi:hypothetical protein